MSREPELPPTPPNNPERRRIPDSEQQEQIVWKDSAQIVWEDSEDVYRPIPKRHSDFQAERGVAAPRVYIKANALHELKDHLASNTRVEQGGILFGNAYQDQQYGVYVEITAAVAAPATIGTGAHLEFTPNSWQGIMDYAKSKHSGENIVGWYHSHPNIGVFMSGTDMRTQRAFFYHPWCLSIVYDPVRDDIGYFLGERAERVQPFIFGLVQHNKPVDEVSDMDRPQHASQQDDIRRKGDENTNTAVVPVSTVKIGRIVLLILPVFALLVVFVMLITNTTNISKDTPKSPTSPSSHSSTTSLANSPTPTIFTASLETMTTKMFEYFEKKQDLLLKYPIIKVGERVGSGNEVTLLLISSEGAGKLKDVQLEFEEIIPKNDVEVDNPIKTLDVGKNDYQSRETQTKLLNQLTEKGGVMIFMFSSHDSKSQQKRVVKANIYIPRKLIYRDSITNKTTEVEIKDIL